MTGKKVEIPRGITPREFFLHFVPETYAERVQNYDMSGYEGFTFRAQFTIQGPEGGEFALLMTDGTSVETCEGECSDALISYQISQSDFGNAVEGHLPWLPLGVFFEPEELRDFLNPTQAAEQLSIMKGIKGQTDVHLTMNNGATAELRANFQGETTPAVTFFFTEPIIDEIRAGEYTIMEAFMAGRFRLKGPVEFAMHVMALAPDREDEE